MRQLLLLGAAVVATGLTITSVAKASEAYPAARIRVALSGDATAENGARLIRQPRISQPIGGVLLSAVMPKVLAQTGESLIAWVNASLSIDANGALAGCHRSESKITHGTGYKFVPANPALGPEACEMLRSEVHFVHAIDEMGRPTSAVVDVRIQLEQGNARLPSAPPPPTTLGPGFPRTSGHVTDATGRWIGWTWVMSDYIINSPDWSTALTDWRKLPKKATVGVLVDLRPRAGHYLVENCQVVRASGDARLDIATCAALVAAGYDQSKARYASLHGIDRYPVQVDWMGDKAKMTALPPVEVPHMPKDVVLKAKDTPQGRRPPEERVQIELQLASSGKALSCEVTHSSGDDAWDAASCQLAKDRTRFSAPLNWFGLPTAGTYELVVDWQRMLIRPRWE